jgi:hypothetical protein
MRGRKLKLVLGLIITTILVISVVPGCSVARAAEAIAFENEAGYVESGEMMKEMPADAVEAEMYAEEAGAPMTDTDTASSELYTQAGNTDTAASQSIDTKLIKNASIAIEVPKGEFEKKFFEVVSLAEQNNGYVSNSQSYSDPDGKMTSGVVTIRVDKDRFDSVLSKIKQMGEVDSISIYVQDVTQEYVDNESRLRNLEAQQKRLLDLMEMSTSVKDSIEVQRELSNVEGQMEVIKGRQNYLDNLVAYSTIDVYIQEPQPITEPSDGGFLGAIKRGIRGALTALRVITMGLIAISPLLAVAGIILIIVWQSIRARNRRRAARQKQITDEQKK